MESAVDVPVPQILEEIGGRIQLILQERMSDRVVEQIVDAHVRQIREHMVEVARAMLQERMQQRTQAKDPAVQVAQKTVEFQQAQVPVKVDVLVPVAGPQVQVVDVPAFLDRVDDVPVSRQRQTPMTREVPKMVNSPRVQFIDKVVSIPVMAQRQVPSAQKVQKIVEMPKIQCCSNRSVPQIIEQIVEAPQIIPREFVLSPREGGTDGNHRLAPQKRKSISECGMTEDEPSENDVRRASASSCEVSCETHGLVQGVESRLEVDETRERHAADEWECLLPVAPNMEAGGSYLQATAEEEQIVDWAQDLREIRRMVEFLVRRERKLDAKADVAVRRLERLEREHSQLENEEREASLQDALADRTKVVKLVVDKWFVDKGFGFGKAPTGEVVFIHASVVRGAEVLTIGTDAWVQVMHDDARAQGGVSSMQSLGARRVERKETRRGQAKRQNK